MQIHQFQAAADATLALRVFNRAGDAGLTISSNSLLTLFYGILSPHLPVLLCVSPLQ